MYVVVWLKIREHDIFVHREAAEQQVVVWLKIREHDIHRRIMHGRACVVVWLKIREHDIELPPKPVTTSLWFD